MHVLLFSKDMDQQRNNMNKIEKAILTELNEWDLSCAEESNLKTELAKALGRIVKNHFIPEVRVEWIVWLDRQNFNRRIDIDEWRWRASKRNFCDNYGRNPIEELGSEIEIIESISGVLEKIEALTKAVNQPSVPGIRFTPPSDKQMVEIATLFNDGKLEADKLADMVAYGQLIIDRLYENGDVSVPSSKEERKPKK